ncbi:MAG: phosphoribosyltransferase family protein [Nocardioides sp.]|nr:phosphoribosyltransferase family protein [Nocardioides sp.]
MELRDREEAGRRLARALAHYRGRDIVVLGLPRGGVPVAFQVALALDAPLDVIVVRKLGLPGHAELAMGAVGEGGVLVTNNDVLAQARVSAAALADAEALERDELLRRVRRFRGRTPPEPLVGRVVIIVDDGVATGATARAACLVARARGAAEVVLAVPVGAADTMASLSLVADEVVCLSTPEPFWAVAQGYRDFEQVHDSAVVALLAEARRRG